MLSQDAIDHRIMEVILRSPKLAARESHPRIPWPDKDDIVLEAELPGLSKEEINGQVSVSPVTINGGEETQRRGERRRPLLLRTILWDLCRTIKLPSEGKADHVEASFKNGVWETYLPKTEEAKRKSSPSRSTSP